VGTKGSSGPSNAVIAGMAILLFGGVLLGVGIHHLIRTGTCSSTGYSANYGPVPTCPSGTGWWVAFLFGGIIAGIIGGFMVAGSGGMTISPMFFGIFGGIGFGALSLLLDSHAKSGTQVFGGIFGGCFAIVGVGAGWAMVSAAFKSVGGGGSTSSSRTSMSRTAAIASVPTVVTNAFTSLNPTSARAPAPRRPAADPLDQIEKLSDLHKSGVLTDEEFEKEKAKLLAES
jgi:hypothetical protein